MARFSVAKASSRDAPGVSGFTSGPLLPTDAPGNQGCWRRPRRRPHRGALRRRADDRGCAARSMPERLASLPATPCACARDSVEVLPLWSVLVGVHVVWMWPTFTATHTIQPVIIGRAATWSDIKRTCAICHEYSWHAPFVSSNSMVVVTNGGHSRSGQHSSPRAPFCTVLGADWGWRLECSSRVRARGHAEAGMSLVQFRGRGDKPWPFCAWLPFSFLRTALPFSLSCPALQQVRAPCH